LDAEQFAIAKKLDPNDPTPWFYDAIRLQTVNRPVEALHNIQRSIDLNDNRVVYRSRLLLDQDLASRGARLGRIYNDLGFQQLALVEGWKFIAEDPSNFSAHRLLADMYAALPRHAIARDSELLQSQLLQPINIDPVQPRLANNGLDFLDDTFPANAGFNEFARLVAANEPLRIQADGIVGTQETLIDNIIASGIYNRFSYSLGQFHFGTDGIRPNNDLTQNLYTAYAQAAVTPATSVMSQLFYTDEDFGDRAVRFNLDDFLPQLRVNRNISIARVGGHHSFGPRSTLLTTYAYRSADARAENDSSRQRGDEDSHSIEARYIFDGGLFKLDTGFGYLRGDVKADVVDLNTGMTTNSQSSDTKHGNGYMYTYTRPFEPAIFTLNLSFDSFETFSVEENEVNPKAGVTARVTEDMTFRAAAFRVLKRNFVASQTLEPTNVAGFNQFFDGINGETVWRYGVGLDQRLRDDLFIGAEFSRRDRQITQGSTKVNGDELFGRAYLYWTPSSWWALSAEYQFDYAEFELSPTENNTIHRVPLEARAFHPSGVFARLRGIYVNQEVRMPDFVSGTMMEDNDSFFVIDAALGFRFPKRVGLVPIEVSNLLDQNFHFPELDPTNPSVNHDERVVLARLTLTF
jgi:hypothetical protein